MTSLRHLVLAAFAAAAALGLSACGSKDTGGEVAASAPIARIAPPAGTAWSEKATVTPEGGYLMGNPDAPIKLLEYGSLTCPACAAFSVNGAEPLKTEYVDSGRVSYEFRSFIIHGPPDLVLTRLIGCGAPEAAHPLSEQIWANLETILGPLQTNPEPLNAALALPENQRFVALAQAMNLYSFFAERGLPEDKARACLADFASMEKLANESEANGNKDKITKTPTFFVNGREVEASSWAQLEPILQRAGAR